MKETLEQRGKLDDEARNELRDELRGLQKQLEQMRQENAKLKGNWKSDEKQAEEDLDRLLYYKTKQTMKRERRHGKLYYPCLVISCLSMCFVACAGIGQDSSTVTFMLIWTLSHSIVVGMLWYKKSNILGFVACIIDGFFDAAGAIGVLSNPDQPGALAASLFFAGFIAFPIYAYLF